MDFIYINETQVQNLLNWEDTINATEVAMRTVAENKVSQPPRGYTNMESAGSPNLLLSMPGFLQDDKYGALACKLITVAPKNIAPLDTANAIICLFNEDNGVLKAIVAGNEITKWRTAAASVVATKHLHLRNPNRKCQILAILGAGNQGRIHALAFQHYFKFDEVRIWNHNPAKAQKLVSELKQLNIHGNIKAVPSNQDCVANADVIITATWANEPIIKLDWIKKDAHINAVGAGISHYSELDMEIYKNSKIYIDYWSGAKAELGGLLDLGVEGQIGDLILKKIGLPCENAVTVFQSLGMAVEDCAMARMVYDLHLKK